MTFTFTRPPEFYAKIVALKGEKSASEIGAIYGLTRNAVIGIWDRAGAPPLTPMQKYDLASRTKAAAWKRRKAGYK